MRTVIKLDLEIQPGTVSVPVHGRVPRSPLLPVRE